MTRRPRSTSDPDLSALTPAQRLRHWRTRRETVTPIGDTAAAIFQKQIAKPHKQVGQLVTLWERLVPPDLAQHTRLASFARGVLLVEVPSSAVHFQLDRLIRSGLDRQMKQAFQGTLRQIRIKVASFDAGG